MPLYKKSNKKNSGDPTKMTMLISILSGIGIGFLSNLTVSFPDAPIGLFFIFLFTGMLIDNEKYTPMLVLIGVGALLSLTLTIILGATTDYFYYKDGLLHIWYKYQWWNPQP